MSIDELQARLVWLEDFPKRWWSNKVGYTEQRKRDELNVRRKKYIEQVEEEIAIRQGGTQ
jgi:hypothetical protein